MSSFCIVAAILGGFLPSQAYAEGDLATIRSETQTSPPEPSETPEPAKSEASSPSGSNSGSQGNGGETTEGLDQSAFIGGLVLSSIVLTSPYWLPRALLEDDSREARFPRFPYDDTQGYLVSDAWVRDFTARQVLATTLAKDVEGSGPANDAKAEDSLVTLSMDPQSRRWGCQFRTDYLDDFSHLAGVGGQFILETTSRWGVDASFQSLRERLPDGEYDHLTLGDCNLVRRFAQSPQAQMRMGLGANWLNDTEQTDLGFNFTYGGDFFPRKPWIVSATIDWGTLGHTGLFRFRTTTGVIFNRFETYVGYEYLDIGTTQGNFLISGLRVWF